LFGRNLTETGELDRERGVSPIFQRGYEATRVESSGGGRIKINSQSSEKYVLSFRGEDGNKMKK